MELLDIKKYFPDFDYPKQLKKIAELDLADFDFWFLMDVELAKSYTEGMAKRFSARHLAPFAKRVIVMMLPALKWKNWQSCYSSRFL